MKDVGLTSKYSSKRPDRRPRIVKYETGTNVVKFLFSE
jgi:hypothetical protein